MTMIERVAEAIYAEFENRPVYAQAQMNGLIATDLARAAIKAMREPTEVMANEGWDTARAMVAQYGFCIGGETPVWQSMIDAALAEK